MGSGIGSACKLKQWMLLVHDTRILRLVRVVEEILEESKCFYRAENLHYHDRVLFTDDAFVTQCEIAERLAGRYEWNAFKLGGKSYEFCLNIFWKDTGHWVMAVLVFTFRDGDASPSGCFWISAKFLVQISSVESSRRGSNMKESPWWLWCPSHFGSHWILKNECRMGLVFKP